jgi:murein DD-endopeptidase MepM/ murein hydrolase activator NlpD
VPINLAPGRLWSTFAPAPDSDHFWVGRAFGPNAEQLASPSYQFGSTAGNRYRTHHGVDISNPFGTPVLAATDGEVVHAGPDDTVLLGPYNNFYGNVVAIRLDRKLSVAGGELDVFLLYGHLSQVTVAVGQRVRPEDVVGMVGMTGIAIGPHLHVEIRLGANTYFSNVNPYLWMAPLEGHGAVAVRALTADGRTWPAARISLVRYAGGSAVWARQIETYMDVENIGPDPSWGENGAMDGVPAGSYYVIGVINGERVSAEITVQAGKTTFVELRTKQ